jgi:hypothetical protein
MYKLYLILSAPFTRDEIHVGAFGRHPLPHPVCDSSFLHITSSSWPRNQILLLSLSKLFHRSLQWPSTVHSPQLNQPDKEHTNIRPLFYTTRSIPVLDKLTEWFTKFVGCLLICKVCPKCTHIIVIEKNNFLSLLHSQLSAILFLWNPYKSGSMFLTHWPITWHTCCVWGVLFRNQTLVLRLMFKSNTGWFHFHCFWGIQRPSNSYPSQNTI